MVLSPFDHLDNLFYILSNLNTLLVLFQQAAIRLCFHNLYLYCRNVFLTLNTGFQIYLFSVFHLLDLNYCSNLRPLRILLLSASGSDLSLQQIVHLSDCQDNPDLNHIMNKNVDKMESNA